MVNFFLSKQNKELIRVRRRIETFGRGIGNRNHENDVIQCYMAKVTEKEIHYTSDLIKENTYFVFNSKKDKDDIKLY